MVSVSGNVTASSSDEDIATPAEEAEEKLKVCAWFLSISFQESWKEHHPLPFPTNFPFNATWLPLNNMLILEII